MNGRIGQLNKLSTTIPLANQQIASGMQQARETQLQAAIGGLTPEQAAQPRLAQAVGAQQAAAAAQIQTQAQQKTQQQAITAGQQAITNEKMKKQQELFTRSQTISQKNRYLEGQLASISQQAKDQLLDQQLSFKRDEFGRTLWNERQLADFRLLTAKSEEEYRAFEQEFEQMSQRRIKMLEVAQAKIAQALKNGFTAEEQRLNNQQRIKLEEARVALQKKLAKEQAKRRGRGAMFQGAGQIIGAGAGAVLGAGTGTPMGAYIGAQVGAQVGGGLGALAASQTE